MTHPGPAPQEPPAVGAPPTSPPSTPDRWSSAFNKVMQTTGLGIVIYQQAVHKSDMWLLIIAAAMMLGGFGLQTLVRGVGNLPGGGP